MEQSISSSEVMSSNPDLSLLLLIVVTILIIIVLRNMFVLHRKSENSLKTLKSEMDDNLNKQFAALIKTNSESFNRIGQQIANNFQQIKSLRSDLELNNTNTQGQLEFITQQIKDLQKVTKQINTTTRNTINENLAEQLKKTESILSSLKSTDNKMAQANQNIQIQIESIIKQLKENEKVSKELKISTHNRDNVLEELVEDFTGKANAINNMINTIYKDFELMMELLKAGLINDLIKDINKKIR